jgi:hypothetical protein
MLRTYADLVDVRVPYATSSGQLSPPESAAVLHAAQHILTKMDIVRRNNERIAEGSMEAADAQDQGLVRPIVLLLAPTRGVAYTVLKALLPLLQQDARCASSRPAFKSVRALPSKPAEVSASPDIAADVM